MGVITTTQEYSCSSVPPARLFKATVLDSHNVIPKIIPSFQGIEIIEGDGGAGTIKKTHFPEGKHFKYLKHKVDVLDAANYYTKFTLIEGDPLDEKIESIVYEIKIEASGTGSVCKNTSHYHTKPGVEIKENDINDDNEKVVGMYKLIENYLIANPSVCA